MWSGTGGSGPKPSAKVGQPFGRVVAPEMASPQQLMLRVEEKKIIENSMGEDVAQLRWRLATVDEAKEVVVCWNNAHGSQPTR